ncbi:unnamed protein product [Mytilus coruscus]|uniref:Mutator-like transposase domain-containing protein n=1 Tax=Mytilus coruscus TaxID=42192 RepID=A0A6J8EIF6_MYTCO|nr:unnamed protein product [Mytilus coruscus]
MWNEVFRELQNVSQHCNGLFEWDLSMEEKWGSAWRECAKCNQSIYRSKMFNLYEEVASIKRGRRAAKINLGLQVGLQHTPISTASYRKICMASNIPPPSVSSLQHTSNAISEKIEEENMRDLQRQREKIKRIKSYAGKILMLLTFKLTVYTIIIFILALGRPLFNQQPSVLIL